MNVESEGEKRREKRGKTFGGARADEYLFNNSMSCEEVDAFDDPELYSEKLVVGRTVRNLGFGILGLLVVALVGIFVLIQWSTKNEDEVAADSDLVVLSFMERAKPAEIKASVEQAVRGFMEGETLEERARYLVRGEEMLPLLKEYYKRVQNPLPRGFTGINEQINSAFGGIPLTAARALDEDRDEHWFTVVSGRDQMLIDWESTVCYGEIEWGNFIKNRAEKEYLMRGYLLRVVDEEQAGKGDAPLYYRVKDRSGAVSIVAEPSRGGKVESLLKSLVAEGESRPMTVRIKFGDGEPFAQITEVVHDLWIDVDRVEKFREGE